MTQLICYKSLPIFSYEDIEEAIHQHNNLSDGLSSKLTILKGELELANMNSAHEFISEEYYSATKQPCLFTSSQHFQVISKSEDLECQMSFYCSSHQLFTMKYQLSPTHSEILAAMPYLQEGNALDVGCGVGRNALYLSQNGFNVEAWDINQSSLDKLNDIIQSENIKNIHVESRDLNQNQLIDHKYDFIYSTVVMMFLQPETIPHLIRQMQAATKQSGFNLIVCAMDTEDYPAQADFPFAFKQGELFQYYQGWKIIKYNENIGELHRRDIHGNRIKQRFATILAQKIR